jgi:glycosyltransferase involved in cell wall biosynthesis
VRRGDYDIVDVTAGASWLLGMFPRRFALVESVHGAEHMYYARWKQEVAKGGYRVVVPRFRRWYPWVQLPLVARAWRNADHIICQASDNRDYMLEEGLVATSKVSVVGNGADQDLLDLPREPRSVRRLLWVSSWIMMKGFRYLVEAFTGLAARVPELTLTIVGDCPANDNPASYFVPDVRARVRVVGAVDRRSMPDLYAEHDVFLFTALGEGFGNVVLEAMAAGLPVISTSVVCALDLIKNGSNGLLVPPGDSAALVRAVESIVADPNLAGRLGAAARETARGHSWETEARNLLRVYAGLLAARNTGSRRL